MRQKQTEKILEWEFVVWIFSIWTRLHHRFRIFLMPSCGTMHIFAKFTNSEKENNEESTERLCVSVVTINWTFLVQNTSTVHRWDHLVALQIQLEPPWANARKQIVTDTKDILSLQKCGHNLFGMQPSSKFYGNSEKRATKRSDSWPKETVPTLLTTKWSCSMCGSSDIYKSQDKCTGRQNAINATTKIKLLTPQSIIESHPTNQQFLHSKLPSTTQETMTPESNKVPRKLQSKRGRSFTENKSCHRWWSRQPNKSTPCPTNAINQSLHCHNPRLKRGRRLIKARICGSKAIFGYKMKKSQRPHSSLQK